MDEPWLDNRILTLPGLIWHAQRTCELVIDAALVRAAYDDIPANGYYVISRLLERKQPFPLSQLIREMSLSKQATGKLVELLVDRNYVTRSNDQGDRRKVSLVLTSQGINAATVATCESQTLEDRVVEAVGREGAAALRRALWELLQSRLNQNRSRA